MDDTADYRSVGRVENRWVHIINRDRNNSEKNELKPWLVEEWCILKAGAEFVAAIEDVLEVYPHPYMSEYPVICFDETNRQLIEATRPSLSAKPEESKKVDFEYFRNSGDLKKFCVIDRNGQYGYCWQSQE